MTHKTALITGITGQDGAYLAEFLLNKGYTAPEEGPGFKIKRIEVNAGGRLSLQSHKHRSEHWVVVSGEATVTNGENILTLRPNESTYIPIGARHRLENLGSEAVQIIEVQVGAYVGEDDIQRYDDIYGRST